MCTEIGFVTVAMDTQVRRVHFDDSATPFLEISPYLRTPDNLQPPLRGDARVDVAIVGGGFTGLSTALALKKAGVSVAVIERRFSGFGASGRNAGHMTPTICKDMPTAIMLFGEEKAAQFVRFADHCVETSEHLIAEYEIDCDYNPSGNIMSVVHPSQEKRLRKATETARSVGAKVRFVEGGEMRERGIPKAFLCGALEQVGGTLHPGKLVLGLRQAALDAGIAVYEETEVTEVTDEAKPRLFTPNGIVTADKVVMAANAYTTEIKLPNGKPSKYLYPLYITLLETEPLGDAQLAAIGGWRGREGIYTAHEALESFRLTAQRTILGGSKDVRYFYGGEPKGHGGEADSSKRANLRVFRERFPELADVRIAHSWSGWIAMTMNFLPMLSQSDARSTLYYSMGYNGHGVSQSLTMGGMVADQILGRANPWQEIAARKPAYLPPEPLRWIGVRSLVGVLNYIDQRIDRRIVRRS